MGAFRVSEPLVIQSHKGPYAVVFAGDSLSGLVEATRGPAHYIVDAKVAEIYARQLAPVLASASVLRIEAKEPNKSLERCPDYITHLMAGGIKRGQTLVAIGGGIIQDITCFLAAILLRGVDWHFYPTTLLAQADSCIGSKSSINVGEFKNIVGTYTPPSRIVVGADILATLTQNEIQSGIGEMLKVHAISGPADFDRIASDYDAMILDRSLLQGYVLRSLEIKKGIIEQDEFDRAIRNVLNLGHSFGHAIESATEFGIPHGIAVTIGIDMAYFVAARLHLTDERHFRRMHPTLAKNYRGFERTPIPAERFFKAISLDKKNTDSKLGLILPNADGIPGRVGVPNDEVFQALCREYFQEIRPSRS
jgi:3-dehydroquinate synthase